MRQPKPFFRKQTKSWYVQLGKQQVNLGSDREKAWEKYCELMAGRQVLETTNTVATVILQFLAWNKKNNRASTHAFYKRHCVSFASYVGEQLKVSELKPYHITNWIDASYPETGGTYRRGAIRSVQRALNWAVSEGRLTYNPLARVKKPRATARDEILTAEQWAEVVAFLEKRTNGRPALLDFLTFMRHTGCCPQEARAIESRHLDRKNRCIVFEREESKGQIDRRVIPLTDEAFALCERCAAKYPTGPLLRNSHGTAWQKHALKERMLKLGRKLGFRIYAYSLRHTWATEALERGVDPITAATIMGHRDVTQLMKTYQHLNKRSEHLRTAMHKALGVKSTPAATSPG